MAWSINALAAGLLVISFAAHTLHEGRGFPVPFKRIAFPATLILCVCLWAFIQSLSFTPEFLHHALWELTSQTLERPIPGAISVNPYETQTTLMRLMTYSAVFWLALQFGRDSNAASLMLRTIGFAIAAYALYGIILYALGLEMILWEEKIHYRESLTSTFINRNTFATFAGMGAIIFAALTGRMIKRALSGDENEAAKYKIQRATNALYGMGSLYPLALVLILSSLFLSNSRGGTICTLIALTTLFAFSLLKSRMNLLTFTTLLFCGAAAFFGLFDLSGEKLAERFGALNGSARSEVYWLTLKAISDSPWVGTGYGTFLDVFPQYRDESTSAWGRWFRAHNTYLEVMLELGVPAALALFGAVGSCIWLCFKGLFKRRRSKHFALIGVCASLLVALHALVDFSLQIPGFTVTYAALLGLCCAQSWSTRERIVQ